MNELLNNYLFWLIILSLFVFTLERLWPARQQEFTRRWLWSDSVYLFFNGHLLGVWLYGIATYHILPPLDAYLAEQGLRETLYFSAMQRWGWSLLTQSISALIIIDFIQWLVHTTLHRVDFLWAFHKIHHSVKEGEMDWIVSFRFSWLEPVIYKAVMYLPMMWFGFASEAIFFHAIFGTLIGHLNHANLTWDYGPLRYVLNSPRMHLYHHAYDAPKYGQNFGIIFSCWDWIFGTIYLPDKPCPKIGFPGVERLPNDFFGQLIWPLPHWVQSLGEGTRLVTSFLGLLVLGGLYGASLPTPPQTPISNGSLANSQFMISKLMIHNVASWETFTFEGFEETSLSLGSPPTAQRCLAPKYIINAPKFAAPTLTLLLSRSYSHTPAHTPADTPAHNPALTRLFQHAYSHTPAPTISDRATPPPP